jgi:hypothetical protein
MVDLLEGKTNVRHFHESMISSFDPLVIAGGQRLQENRYVRLHIYRCHWCAPIDAHYNTAKQLSQHVRSKHYRLLQALLTTQANMLQSTSRTSRGKRSRDNEQDESMSMDRVNPGNVVLISLDHLTSNSLSTLNPDRLRQRSSNVLQTNSNQDSSPRLPIPIGLPDSLTGRFIRMSIDDMVYRCFHLY